MVDRSGLPVGERVAALEIEMAQLTGNGQPGMIKNLTDKVEELSGRIVKLILIVTIVEVLTHLISGGGTVSLKALIDLLK